MYTQVQTSINQTQHKSKYATQQQVFDVIKEETLDARKHEDSSEISNTYVHGQARISEMQILTCTNTRSAQAMIQFQVSPTQVKMQQSRLLNSKCYA